MENKWVNVTKCIISSVRIEVILDLLCAPTQGHRIMLCLWNLFIYLFNKYWLSTQFQALYQQTASVSASWYFKPKKVLFSHLPCRLAAGWPSSAVCLDKCSCSPVLPAWVSIQLGLPFLVCELEGPRTGKGSHLQTCCLGNVYSNLAMEVINNELLNWEICVFTSNTL